jgi:hypothetical protein
MTSKFGPLGIIVDDRYRTIPEERIVEMLLLVGWAYETLSPEAAAATKEALQLWTQIGLGFRLATNGERLFDPVEVVNFMTRAGVDGRHGFWEERNVHTLRRLVSDLSQADPSGLPAGGKRRFVVDYKRVFNLRSVAPGSRLRLRAPLPLEGDYLWNLKVTPFAKTVHDAQVDVRPGRLEVKATASGEAELVVGATLSFTARPQEPESGQDAAEPDRALYLRHQEGLIVVSERISALARSLAGDGATSVEAVRAFWEYMHRDLFSGVVHYDQIDLAAPCDWVLDSGWFDCQMGAALFVALCRAYGIPARIAGGYVLYRKAPTAHYWAEVWMENQGWTPFDFMTWNLSRGGRDREWLDRFFGRLDCRLTTQRMPNEFTGAIGVPIPPAWTLLLVPTSGGVEINFLNIDGTPVHADTISVQE